MNAKKLILLVTCLFGISALADGPQERGEDRRNQERREGERGGPANGPTDMERAREMERAARDQRGREAERDQRGERPGQGDYGRVEHDRDRGGMMDRDRGGFRGGWGRGDGRWGWGDRDGREMDRGDRFGRWDRRDERWGHDHGFGDRWDRRRLFDFPAIGRFATLSPDGYVFGWACDPDAPFRAVEIVVLVDGFRVNPTRDFANQMAPSDWRMGYDRGSRCPIQSGFAVRIPGIERISGTDADVEVLAIESDMSGPRRQTSLGIQTLVGPAQRGISRGIFNIGRDYYFTDGRVDFRGMQTFCHVQDMNQLNYLWRQMGFPNREFSFVPQYMIPMNPFGCVSFP